MNDNVTPMPSLSERLVMRARRAQEKYTEGMALETKGREQARDAVIEYGLVLLEGRGPDVTNATFGQWIRDHGLDQGEPWCDRRERAAAMAIAKLVDGKDTVNPFSDCPYTTPTNIMKWYRRQHPSPKAKLKADATAKAREAIKEMEARGETITEDRISERAGVAAGTANKAFNIHKTEVAATAKATAEVQQRLFEDHQLANANFSDKSKLTIEKAIELHKKRLNAAFEPAVQNEVNKRLDAIEDRRHENAKKVAAENLQLRQIFSSKIIFTVDEFKLLLAVAHPDNSASPEKRARAFDLLKQKQKRLTGE